MKPLVRDRLPYCSLLCDEIQNFEGRRVCRLTNGPIAPKFIEAGALCVPARELTRWHDPADNPGCTLLRTVVAEVRDA